MTDLTKVTDKELVLEIYRRIKGESEMHDYRDYLYRAAFRPIKSLSPELSHLRDIIRFD